MGTPFFIFKVSPEGPLPIKANASPNAYRNVLFRIVCRQHLRGDKRIDAKL